MKELILVLLLLSSSCFAIDISKIESDDFDTREEGTKELAHLDYENLNELLCLFSSYKESDPELSIRLYNAAKEMYRINFTYTDERALRLRASLDCDGEYINIYPVALPNLKGVSDGFRVRNMWLGSCLCGKIIEGDIIVKVDGWPFVDIIAKEYNDYSFHHYGYFMAGKTIEITYMHPSKAVDENKFFDIYTQPFTLETALITVQDRITDENQERLDSLIEFEFLKIVKKLLDN